MRFEEESEEGSEEMKERSKCDAGYKKKSKQDASLFPHETNMSLQRMLTSIALSKKTHTKKQTKLDLLRVLVLCDTSTTRFLDQKKEETGVFSQTHTHTNTRERGQ